MIHAPSPLCRFVSHVPGWRLVAASILTINATTALSRPLGDLIFADGFEDSCDIDTDNDGLSDCLEAVHGTSPTNPDTDGDGLRDGDEVLGTEGGLNLPAMGVDPRRKDILIEHDWTDEATGCAAHSHKPPNTTLEALRQIFADAPVVNDNGQTGINLINDVGQGGQFTGGNVIAIPNGTIQGDVSGIDFANYKATNLASNRLGYFHYAIHAHQYSADPGSSGYAEIVGDDLIVTLQCSLVDYLIINTTMHELGHNLGLQHGGDTSCNYKPNYNSIMNYIFQFPGIDTNCDRFGDGPANYSVGTRITLNENSLDESAGMCGNTPIDWNGNGAIESGIQADVNSAGNNTCGGQFTTLTDFDDWTNMIVDSLPGGPGGAGGVSIGVSCQQTPVLK